MAKRSEATTYQGTPGNIARLARALRRGDLVAVPTETVYGLAANALDARACRKIFRAKGRPSNDPLIVHIHRFEQLAELAEVNAEAKRVAKAFWPGPLTLVLPKKPHVPSIVTSGLPSVAVRSPKHPLFRKLLRAARLPLAAPSANPFGYISPTTAEHVREGLRKKISHILDGGPCEIGLESTILDLRDPARPRILRPGAIERAALEKVLGRRVSIVARPVSQAATAALAPGMLTKHYSPRTPLVLHAKISPAQLQKLPPDEVALLIRASKGRVTTTARSGRIVCLTENGDLAEAAQLLFARLRELDRGRWKRIHAELAPGRTALALAINDRLTRAAAKR
jgi:L-threonylcarbamoyladenylate synthase